MRITPAVLLAATFAGTLSAQRPLGGAPGGAILQTVTFDVAGAFQERYRATTEALVFGRFSIGLSGEYTRHSEIQSGYYPPVLAGCPIQMLCASDAFSSYGPQYRAWSFNLHGRWYPRPLSFDGMRQSASVYLGEFIGYHERRIRQPLYTLDCPYCAGPPTPGDSVVVVPGGSPQVYPYPDPSFFTQKLHGWEPGVEFGVRIRPSRHVVIDMGGTFRLETLQDPQSGIRAGGVIKQLTVAVGVGW